MNQADLFAAANVRRWYWRMNPIARRISEEEFVARGYDRALLETLGAPSGAAPQRAVYQREPGEDLFEGGVPQ